MDKPPAAELPGIELGVGHVVTVGQEDVGHATQGVQLAHEAGQELGRIDEPVAVPVANEIAVAAEGLGGIEAAIKHRRLDGEGKVIKHGLSLVLSPATDGPGGAADQGVEGVAAVFRGGRLVVDERMVLGFAEDGGGQLTARVAVDTGRIHEVWDREHSRERFSSSSPWFSFTGKMGAIPYFTQSVLGIPRPGAQDSAGILHDSHGESHGNFLRPFLMAEAART